MNGIMTQENKTRLDQEASAKMLLMLDGWSLRSESQAHDGRVWLVWFASKDGHLEKRGLSIGDLAKRISDDQRRHEDPPRLRAF